MDRYDRTEAIVLAGEHHLEFALFEFGTRGAKRSLSLPRSFAILGAFVFGDLQEHASLVEPLAEPAVGVELLPYLVLLAKRGLGRVGAVPEIRFGGQFEELFLAGFQGGDVKDASRAYRRTSRSRSVVVEGRITFGYIL